MRCSPGVRAASSGSAATGTLARLPSNGKACSMPQYDTSNRGLIRTISAMLPTLLANIRRRLSGARGLALQVLVDGGCGDCPASSAWRPGKRSDPVNYGAVRARSNDFPRISNPLTPGRLAKQDYFAVVACNETNRPECRSDWK